MRARSFLPRIVAFATSALFLPACVSTPQYRSVVIKAEPTSFFDSSAVGTKAAPNLNQSYNSLLMVCSQRLGALEQEYSAISGRTASWRTALLVVGGLSAMGTAGYALFEDDPDPK